MITPQREAEIRALCERGVDREHGVDNAIGNKYAAAARNLLAALDEERVNAALVWEWYDVLSNVVPASAPTLGLAQWAVDFLTARAEKAEKELAEFRSKEVPHDAGA